MLTVLALLARRFNKRVVAAFVFGALLGSVCLLAVLKAHIASQCSPAGVPGLYLCKVS
jgi:hypothetical protein